MPKGFLSDCYYYELAINSIIYFDYLRQFGK